MGIRNFVMFAIAHTAQNFQFRLASPARYLNTPIAQETIMTLRLGSTTLVAFAFSGFMAGGVMRSRLTLAIIASFLAAPAFAEDGGATAARGLYGGIFGGGGVRSSGDVTQRGTVFFTEAAGGPMAVNATGQTDSSSAWLFGAQIGHEWAFRSVLAALEVEGLYLPGRTQHARLENPTDRLPEHTFDDSFKMSSGVILGNLVLSFPKVDRSWTPYIGGGIGFARVNVTGADSTQINPPEADVNHFNSGTDSSAWTLAAQAKAGVRFALDDHTYLFGEYRYLLIDAADQKFGSTVYSTHAPTSEWTARFDATSYHLATFGIGLSF